MIMWSFIIINCKICEKIPHNVMNKPWQLL